MEKFELIATCAFGLEKLVYDELKHLGLWVIKKEDGRVTFEGDQRQLIRTNLWLRCADRVQIKMAEFKAETFDELFDQTNFIEWEKLIGPNDVFPIQATSVKSVLHSEPAIQSIVKKAIVKRLQAKHQTEELPENSKATYQIVVKTNKDQFIISIDSSGDSLHKRGYRTQANLAPIKETLAAALVKLAEWPDKAGERSLVDPFCGSGTIAIEAGLIAQNIAPGIIRGAKNQFAFCNWSWIDQQILEEACLEARNSAKPSQKLPIYCFDIDADSLVMAKENTTRSELQPINFKRADFNDLDFSKFQNCTFVTNPPYGERLDHADVKELYRQFGQQFSQSQNCSLFIITSDEDFPKLFAEATNRHPDKNRKLYNGKIKCHLYQYYANPTK